MKNAPVTPPDTMMASAFLHARRAQIWSIVDPMFKHQWAGDKDAEGGNPVKTGNAVAVASHAVGPYGRVYGARKASTTDREGWTPKHRDNDARRIMTKALVEDLWRVWNGNPPLCKIGH